jgi:FixJ family two-component response regulator
VTSSTRVFVVDDDPSARSGLSRLLRTAGHDVQDFATANEFLDSLDSDATGCVVLDIRMPGLTGEELQAKLKARGVCLRIIVVTGEDDSETRRKAQKLGATAFFRKPVDGKALLDAIDWTLRWDNHDSGELKEFTDETEAEDENQR